MDRRPMPPVNSAVAMTTTRKIRSGQVTWGTRINRISLLMIRSIREMPRLMPTITSQKVGLPGKMKTTREADQLNTSSSLCQRMNSGETSTIASTP